MVTITLIGTEISFTYSDMTIALMHAWEYTVEGFDVHVMDNVNRAVVYLASSKSYNARVPVPF